MGLKQARSWFVFPREFFVSGVTCSARAFGCSLCGDLRWLRDVTGESSPPQSLIRGSVTALAQLRPPPMVGFVERVQRAGFQVSLARV